MHTMILRGLFAIAAASFAALSLAYGEFAGGQPLPAWIPWQEAWVYASALLLLAASAGLLLPCTALASTLVIGGYLAVWALISVPMILAQPLVPSAWYPFCEATSVLAGAWILYALLRWPSARAAAPIIVRHSVRTAQVVFGLACVFYGSSHFAYADYTAGMVPAWLPGPLALAYFTGLAHMAGGAGIILGLFARLAAILEATMMSLFGLLVWLPSFFAQPRPDWAQPPQAQWSELVVNLLLVAAAWVVASSLRASGRSSAPAD